jgi:magnesium-transporting ATPase (P-type)
LNGSAIERDEQKILDESVDIKKKLDIMRKIQKKWQSAQNVRNFFKVLLIFFIQITMMSIMLYTQFLGPLINNDPQEEQTYPFLMLTIRILCALMLHLTL